MAVRAMKGGAVNFFTKPIDDATLLKSVARAFLQNRANRREMIEHEEFAARYETLTPREREVWRCWFAVCKTSRLHLSWGSQSTLFKSIAHTLCERW